MNPPLIILAQEDTETVDAFADWFNMSDDARHQLLLILALFIVVALVLWWAAFIRKSKKRRRRIQRPHTWQLSPEEIKTGRRHRHRDRRRRTAHPRLPQNPTLADTGGLPPRRPDEPPPAP